MGLYGLESTPMRGLEKLRKALQGLTIEEESYNPAAHTKAYQGEDSPQAAKAKKNRRKKNKAARKARRKNRKR